MKMGCGLLLWIKFFGGHRRSRLLISRAIKQKPLARVAFAMSGILLLLPVASQQLNN